MLQLLVSLFLIQTVVAAPFSLEVWFLSTHKKAVLEQSLKYKPYIFRPQTAELQCQEMGDNCFDPQYGLYKKDDAGKVVDATQIATEKTTSIPAAKSIERELIDCDPKNYFDIFCGKARKEAAAQNFKLDLWIDTSSSMREMDFSDKEGGCYRKSLLNRLDQSCGFNQKVNVMMFDTVIKQAGSMDSVCTNSGLNDTKRMIDWIERSNAKRLVIITDVSEFNKEFADYIDSKHGKVKGDKDLLTAADLLDLVDNLAATCK